MLHSHGDRPKFLYGRHQQANHRNNGDHNEQLDNNRGPSPRQGISLEALSFPAPKCGLNSKKDYFTSPLQLG